MPQVRVDPLTGLKTIIAGERADRPGGGFAVAPDAPIDAETRSVRARPRGRRRRPRSTPCDPTASAPDTPGWSVRAFPNLYPALDPEARSARADAYPDLFTAQPAAGAHEVIVNAPEPVTHLADLSHRAGRARRRRWRERMRAHAAPRAGT